MDALTTAHGKLKSYWTARAAAQGHGYVGRISEDHLFQQKRIEDMLRKVLTPNLYYPEMVDFGCGYGRFIPFWSAFAGHITAVDLIPDMLKAAAAQAPHVTAVSSKAPLRLPLPDGLVDALWGCLVFQHIVDEELFQSVARELTRVLKPGARVLLLDNAQDKAPHVKPRGPQALANAFALRRDYRADLVTINQRPQDHWFIDGRRT